MPATNVDKVMKALAAHPTAMKNLQDSLNEASKTANVKLNPAEKAEFLQHMGNELLQKNAAVIGWV